MTKGHAATTAATLSDEWTRTMAPVTGDIRSDLINEAAEFLGISVADAFERLATGSSRFKAEWTDVVSNDNDAKDLTRFYNHSDAELFELLDWHAVDPIHLRAIVLKNTAVERPGRSYLDYGSGIGSDALVFAHAGFDVTLADISDLLLAFATFRCRRRGFNVRAIDLKKQSLPDQAFDVIVCFDVLEHIPKPLTIVRQLRQALRPGGLVAIHAPFGVDPERPMHVVHRDVVTPRMRSMGFDPQDLYFPPGVLGPHVYAKAALSLPDRLGYFVYDGYLQNRVGTQLAGFYRRVFRRPSEPAAARM